MQKATRTAAGSATAQALASAAHAKAPRSHVAFISSMLRELARRDPDGSRLGGTTDVDQAAVLAADRVLDTSLLWMDHLGPCYDTEGVRSLLARGGEPVSRQAVHKRKGLLALRTGSGQVVYPAFQFRGRRPAPGLHRILSVVPETVLSRWTLASWLVSPERALAGARPIDVLFAGDDPGTETVVLAARQWATQLAS